MKQPEPKTVRRAVVTAIAVLIGLGEGASMAETPAPAHAPTPAPKVDQKSAEYRQGYADGCEHATTGDQRNETLFRSNASYRGGWIVGFQNCYPHLTINTNGDPNGPFKNPF